MIEVIFGLVLSFVFVFIFIIGLIGIHYLLEVLEKLE